MFDIARDIRDFLPPNITWHRDTKLICIIDWFNINWIISFMLKWYLCDSRYMGYTQYLGIPTSQTQKINIFATKHNLTPNHRKYRYQNELLSIKTKLLTHNTMFLCWIILCVVKLLRFNLKTGSMANFAFLRGKNLFLNITWRHQNITFDRDKKQKSSSFFLILTNISKTVTNILFI